MEPDTREPENAATDPEEWVDLHGDVLFRFALSRLRNDELAEELVQETFLAAFRSHKSFEGRAKERTWLIQILKNKIVDHYRRRSREMPASDFSAEDEQVEDLFNARGGWGRKPAPWRPDPSELLESTEFLTVLDTCLEDLPDRQAEVFTLRVVDSLGGAEVCKILDLTSSNVGVLLHRARMRLRRCLELRWFEGQGGRD